MSNVQQAVPFFWVTEMNASLRGYADGLGFQPTKKWVVEDPIRWYWLGTRSISRARPTSPRIRFLETTANG
jgi:hypothetical protein